MKRSLPRVAAVRVEALRTLAPGRPASVSVDARTRDCSRVRAATSATNWHATGSATKAPCGLCWPECKAAAFAGRGVGALHALRGSGIVLSEDDGEHDAGGKSRVGSGA